MTDHPMTTKDGRGKDGYRAPELLQDPAKYNKKLDIWSLGCLLFELTTGQKAFLTDFHSYQFAQGFTELRLIFPHWLNSSSKAVLSTWIKRMLCPESRDRPSAYELSSNFRELRPLLQPHPDSAWSTCNATQKEKTLGTDVPCSLGVLRWEDLVIVGDIDQHKHALQRYDRIIASRTNLLGSRHPYTLWSMLCSAWLRFYLGLSGDAAIGFQQVLVAKTNFLGAEHPETLATRLGLAWTYLSEGNPDSGAILEDILKTQIQVKTLGPEHPDTLDCRHALATLACTHDDFERAARIYEEVYEIQMRVLGNECSDTLLSKSALAWAYLQMGRKEKAAQMYDEVLQVQRRKLGNEHVDTQQSISGRAWAYSLMGKGEEAIEMFIEVLELRGRVLGWHHALTMDSVAALVGEYKGIGRKGDASRLKKRVRDMQKVL